MPFDINANPLLDFNGLPRFDAIRPGHVTPAVDALLGECRAAITDVANPASAATWDSVVEPLDDSMERLSRAWGNVSYLNAVVDTPELREQYNSNLPRLTSFWTELSQNESLYARYKELAARPDFASWSAGRRRVIEIELRDFRLGGAELPAHAKARLKQVRERAAQLTTRFAENVLDATNAFSVFIEDASRLAGLPDDALQMLREAAEEDDRAGYKITLHSPSYTPVLQYADDRALRALVHRAAHTRASDLGKPEWDNSDPMLELLRLRREAAHLLGYRSYAELSLEPKMASSPDEVLVFLRDLSRRSRPYAEADMTELRDFATAELNLPVLEAWDIAYASEKLRQRRYAYSEQELKQFFPEPKVLAGLFKVIENLFSVVVRPDRGSVWIPDAQLYRIEAKNGELIGQFYLDLYAREHKQGGAWQDDARNRRRTASGLSTPVSFLTCNFSRPVGGKPALFTHDEVLTLFHEFGHGLHHLLTRVDEVGVAGIRGVEWDAVELPSQFMENFAWEWDVLQLMTGHVETGAALPRALFDKMIAAKNFQSGFWMARQLEFALFDMRVHHELEPANITGSNIARLIEDVRREVSVVKQPEYLRPAHGFTHIFAGGYAAGYYSYKWAEVLSADCYAAFEESGHALDGKIGLQFLDSILAVGGSRPAMESFVEFRGRRPQIDALLRHSGMAN
jgi:oligopeptidase A